MRSVVRVHLSPDGGVAQLGEHLPCKQGVMSSNLTISTLAKSEARDEISRRLMSPGIADFIVIHLEP